MQQLRYKMVESDMKAGKNQLHLTYPNEKTQEYLISNTTLNGKLIRPVRSVEGGPVPEHMMEVVDEYLALMPVESQRVIFKTFEELTVKIWSMSQNDMVNMLKNYSYRIFSLPGLFEGGIRDPNGTLARWVRETTPIPANVFQSMSDAPPSYKETSTYLVSDYLELVELVIYIKIMFPMVIIAADKLKTNYRKRDIMKASEAICIEHVQQLDAYKKLYSYVEAFASVNYDLDRGSRNTPLERLLYDAGIPTTEICDYLLSEVIIRRMTSSRTRRDIESAHPVVRMYSRLESIKESRCTYVDKKIAEGSGGEDDPTRSVTDDYRMRDNVNVDLQVQLVYVVNPDYLSTHLKIPITVLKKMFGNVNKNEIPPFDDLQLHIIRISIGHLITPHTLPLLGPEELLLVAIATHLYIRDDHPQLAALLVSESFVTPEGVTHSSLYQKSLGKEETKNLLRLYPFDLSLKINTGTKVITRRVKVTELIRRMIEDYRASYGSYVHQKFITNNVLEYFNDWGGLEDIKDLSKAVYDLIIWSHQIEKV